MRTLRALWQPLTFPVLVLVILPLLTLAAPEGARRGWLVLSFLLSPAVAWASVRALRSALARIPVPDSRAEPSYREVVLERSLRWLLVLVTVLGTLTLAWAASSAKAYQDALLAPPAPDAAPSTELSPYQALFLSLVPLFFVVMGVRMWRDLVAARRRRAEGLDPIPLERPTATGDARLDELLGRKPVLAQRLVWIFCFVSALAYLSLRQSLLEQLSKVNAWVTFQQPWRFLTASFVHGDLTSLAVGVLAFLLVAPLVEMLLGGTWLGIVLVGGGMVATLASCLFVPGLPPTSKLPLPPGAFMGLTGADAALTGVLLFFAVLHRNRLPPAVLRRVAVRGLAAVVIIAFAGALLPYADTAAHLGGFTFGAAASLAAWPGGATRAAMEKARSEALARG
jgi:membrane associated rhomboid family serine protease